MTPLLLPARSECAGLSAVASSEGRASSRQPITRPRQRRPGRVPPRRSRVRAAGGRRQRPDELRGPSVRVVGA